MRLFFLYAHLDVSVIFIDSLFEIGGCYCKICVQYGKISLTKHEFFKEGCIIMVKARRGTTAELERAVIEKWLRVQQNPEQYLSCESLARLREMEKTTEGNGEVV